MTERQTLIGTTPLSHEADTNAAQVQRNHAPRSSRLTKSLMLVIVFACISGFLFGYDSGVVAGALLLLKTDFDMSPFDQELFVAITMGGAAIGSIGGELADRLGRRKSIGIGSVLFLIGAALLAVANAVWVLLLGRFIVGLGIGLSSSTVPVYVAELAPPRHRGALVTIQNLAITSGQFISYLVDAAFLDVPGTWRWMLGLAALPALIQLVGVLCLLPESPVWLMTHAREEEARSVLQRMSTDEVEAADAFADLENSMAARVRPRRNTTRIRCDTRSLQKRSPNSVGALLRAFWAPPMRKLLLLGMSLQFFQQFCGINTLMYYSASILADAGFGDASHPRTAIYMSCLVAFANALFTVVALFLVDRVGRRPMVLYTLPGVALGLGILGFTFFAKNSSNASLNSLPIGAMSLIGMIVYIGFFATGMGPAPWLVNAEIYPSHLSGAANGVATTVNWLSNLVVSISFLTLFVNYTSFAFFIYMGIAFIAWLWLYHKLFETKGMSLTEVQRQQRTNNDNDHEKIDQ